MAGDDIWPKVHEERAALGEFLRGLSPGQWDAPSLCTGWRVRDVVAHLISTAEMTPASFFRGFAASGFRFGAFSAKNIARFASCTPSELTERFEASASRTSGPPGPALTPLGEVLVHSEDISRAIGLQRSHAPATVLTVLDFYRGTQPLIGAKKRVAGLQLRATDLDWERGSGPELSGPGMSLLLAMAGRRAGLDDLEGPGVAVISARL